MKEDGNFLRAAARACYGTALSPFLVRRADDYPDSGSCPPEFACPECKQIWVPCVTCSVRVQRQARTRNKNKRARSRASRKKQAYIRLVETRKGDDFRPRDTGMVSYKCYNCGKQIAFTVVLREDPKKNSRRKPPSQKHDPKSEQRPQKEKKQKQKPPLLKPSLSLNDFLL